MAYKSSVLNNETKQSVGTNDNENKESTALIWFHPNIRPREDTEQAKEQLRLINNYVIFSNDLEHCIELIESIDKEKIFLISSGAKASQILPRTSYFRQIDSIFIFSTKTNRYEYLLNEYSKIIGIYSDIHNLSQSIKEQIDLVNKQIETFCFFDQHQTLIKDLSKESAEFLWFQLFNYVITRFPRNQQTKQQIIQLFKEYYHGNTKEIELINEFEQYYRSEDAIRWYSKQSFVYKLINKALRTQDTDFLYQFRFFISDLSQNLQRQHKKLLSTENILNVYRGVQLNKDVFNQLKKNQGKLISINGYLSTTRRKSRALAFAKKPTNRTDVISVLFHIQCDIKLIDKNIIFGDIAQFTEYPNEQEVLFDLNACFQIESMQEQESLQIIKMNLSNEGQKIAKDFIKLTQKDTEELSISIIFGRLLCNLGQYDKSLKYFQQLFNDSNDEERAWIEFNIGRAFDFKGEWNEARKYYDRAYDRMMKKKPARTKESAHVLINIGAILSDQKKYNEALDYYQRALKIQEQFYPSDHVDIATSLNNIGVVLYRQRKYDEALGYYQRALKIQEKFYSSDHVDIAHSFNNMGVILYQQRKYDEALDYYQRALKIREKFYPSGHITTGSSLNNIGICCEKQKKQKMALDYYQHALTIYEKCVPVNHASRQSIENSIRRLTEKNSTD
ncbi:unnamed protein product [Rotaria sp. Silwood2]|nr:unnamed protein product [Rotaria sp. Silwood2]CAF2793452.1 unnamed protein product [Rotaria sp. Silwood2]CAF2921448.1 unnamed protein product [Rotaria sp. Silwood2]CAF2957611.1 unnamed protein product [Rotaria sp. Silwood2]CAF3886715.1 unnamed protein product [Rotaria sp. Silwood2]